METSDSEYFESADEDFQSDVDDEPSSVKIVEKNAKTLLDDKKNANKKCEVNANEKKLDNDKVASEIIAAISNATLEESQKNNSSQDESPRNISKKADVDNNKVIEEDNKETQQKIVKPAKIGVKKVTKQDATEKQQEKKNIPKTKEPPESENLWDDDEINWEQEKQEESMWDNDDWEPIENTPQNIPNTQPASEEQSSWGSWGTWGMSSILSTATHGVSTLTQGISTVLESGMGVPDPEEMAKLNRAEKERIKQLNDNMATEEDENKSGFGLGNLVSGVSHLTKLVETTSTKVISGGLDTLETIGKKTMEVLQDGDPGLKKKRAFLQQDKPVLSQLLREAKEKAEEENRMLEQQHIAKKAKNYETLFDDHHGLVHLEALEMLSKQCNIKLETILETYEDETLIEMQETLEQVKELCELPDDEDDDEQNFEDKLNAAVAEIHIPITYKRLIETWQETETWLNQVNLDICDEHELHQASLDTLAQLTAIAVEQFHKAGELLLVKEHRSTADEADSLVQLTTTLTGLIGYVAGKFSEKLNAKSAKTKSDVNGLITNVFFEAANSSSYIQDAFQLLIPVLQVGAV